MCPPRASLLFFVDDVCALFILLHFLSFFLSLFFIFNFFSFFLKVFYHFLFPLWLYLCFSVIPFSFHFPSFLDFILILTLCFCLSLSIFLLLFFLQPLSLCSFSLSPSNGDRVVLSELRQTIVSSKQFICSLQLIYNH